MKKYCTKSTFGTDDGITKLVPSDDVANVNCGSEWHMPSKTQLDELRTNCTWNRATKNGVNGYLVRSNKTQKGVFLPVAGYRDDTMLKNAGSIGYYWSYSLDTSFPCDSYELLFKYDVIKTIAMRRYYGESVRPVCKK